MAWVGTGLAAGLLGALLATAALGDEVSDNCLTELARRQAMLDGGDRQALTEPLWWVAVNGENQGPWSIFEIKRRMYLGELPKQIYAVPVNQGDWALTTDLPQFQPLPGDSTLGAAGGDFHNLLPGCWVSDPVSPAEGQVTTWMFLIFPDGSYEYSRAVVETASNQWALAQSKGPGARWAAQAQPGGGFVFALPGIEVLAPEDRFPAQLVDRDTLAMKLPGIGALTFRRM